MSIKYLSPAQMHYTRWAQKIPDAIRVTHQEHGHTELVLENPLYLYLDDRPITTSEVVLSGMFSTPKSRYFCHEGLLLTYATFHDQGDPGGLWILAALLKQYQAGMLTPQGILYQMQYNTLGLVGLGVSSYCPDCYEKPWDPEYMAVLKPKPNYCYLCGISFFEGEA